VPSNEGRGYVLRRIIRRASRYAKSLDISEPVLYQISDAVAETMSSVYPELNEEKSRVQKMLRLEEERFMKTLEQGLLILNEVIRQTRKSGLSSIPGGELFRLYDTFGFPLDIARDVASEHNLPIDEPGFHREMEQQKTKARASWVGEETSASTSIYKELFRKHKATEFAGYDSFDAEGEVLALIRDGRSVDELSAGTEGEVLLDRTAFYAESGGQIGDRGQLIADHVRVSVLDTRKPVEGMHLHRIRVAEGSLKTGMKVKVSVDKQKRLAIMRNHTATHLLHASLRNIAGEHVKQAGSYVSDERIRFDFTHFQSLSSSTIEALEDEVNESILRNIPLDIKTMETKKALKAGATALFGEKYGDLVRVISVPGISSELCGGTHAHATGDIGLFKIISEGSVAAGIRRIEAVTGRAAISFFREEEAELRNVCESLKITEKPADRISRLLSEMKDLEKELESLKGKNAAASSGDIVKAARDINGVKAVAYRLDGIDAKDLRIIADNVRDALGSGILVMASVKDKQASIVAMVTTDLTKKFSAGTILKEIAAAAGGKGGGKADTAQGGTNEIGLLDKALESLYDILNKT